MIPKASEQKINKEALLKARAQRLEKLKAKRGEYDAEARKEGHDPLGVPPPNPEIVPAPSPQSKNKKLVSLANKEIVAPGKRPAEAPAKEPAAKKPRASKSNKSAKVKGDKEVSGEVALSFPPNSSVRNKEGWDDVYSELSKLEFEYDKAAIESLGRKEAFRKAVRHQMKVISLNFLLNPFYLFNVKHL